MPAAQLGKEQERQAGLSRVTSRGAGVEREKGRGITGSARLGQGNR